MDGLLEAVQKELRLTAEQVRRTPELSRRSGLASALVPDADLERLLNADQVRRLRQLSLQQMERVAGAGYLLRFREVIEALRPSEDQIAKLGAILEEANREYPGRSGRDPMSAEDRKKAQARLDEVLTKEQQRAFAETLGEPFAGELPVQAPDRGFSPRSTSSFARRAPTHATLRYLTQPDVRAELKLTAAQLSRLQDIGAQREDVLKDYATRASAEQSKKLSEANEAAEKAVEAALGAAQYRRLKQIVMQQRQELNIPSSPGSPGHSVFLEADIVAELKLTAEQQEKIRALLDHGGKVHALILRQHWGDTSPPVVELHATVAERVRNVLSKEQRAKWQEMVGEPFKGQLSPAAWGALP